MGAAPLTVDFLFVCTFKSASGPSMPVCMRVCDCGCVHVVLSVKREAYESKLG